MNRMQNKANAEDDTKLRRLFAALGKYKPSITLFSILTIIGVLFPPVVWETKSRILDNGFSFLLSISNYMYPPSFLSPNVRMSNIGGSINFTQLILEILIFLIISILFLLCFEKIKKIVNEI